VLLPRARPSFPARKRFSLHSEIAFRLCTFQRRTGCRPLFLFHETSVPFLFPSNLPFGAAFFYFSLEVQPVDFFFSRATPLHRELRTQLAIFGLTGGSFFFDVAPPLARPGLALGASSYVRDRSKYSIGPPFTIARAAATSSVPVRFFNLKDHHSCSVPPTSRLFPIYKPPRPLCRPDHPFNSSFFSAITGFFLSMGAGIFNGLCRPLDPIPRLCYFFPAGGGGLLSSARDAGERPPMSLSVFPFRSSFRLIVGTPPRSAYLS